jgi:hypothetical protein
MTIEQWCFLAGFAVLVVLGYAAMKNARYAWEAATRATSRAADADISAKSAEAQALGANVKAGKILEQFEPKIFRGACTHCDGHGTVTSTGDPPLVSALRESMKRK